MALGAEKNAEGNRGLLPLRIHQLPGPEKKRSSTGSAADFATPQVPRVDQLKGEMIGRTRKRGDLLDSLQVRLGPQLGRRQGAEPQKWLELQLVNWTQGTEK